MGILSADPGSTNVVPYETTFSLDVRSTSDGQLDEAVAALERLFRSIADSEGLTVEIAETWRLPAAEFDPSVRRSLRAAADRLGHRTIEVAGGIGHDSLHLARICPAAMVFTPTRSGLSHCEQESSPWDATVQAVDVLAEVLLELADES